MYMYAYNVCIWEDGMMLFIYKPVDVGSLYDEWLITMWITYCYATAVITVYLHMDVNRIM